MTPLFFFCNRPLHLCNSQMTPLFLICNPPFCSLFSNVEAKAKHIETTNCICVTVHKRLQSKSSQCSRKGEYTPNLHCHLSPEVKYMETVIIERQWLSHITIVNVLPRAETHLWWTLVPPVPALRGRQKTVRAGAKHTTALKTQTLTAITFSLERRPIATVAARAAAWISPAGNRHIGVSSSTPAGTAGWSPSAGGVPPACSESAAGGVPLVLASAAAPLPLTPSAFAAPASSGLASAVS